MKRLILRPRNLGYTNFLGIMHRSMFMSNSAKLEAGLFAFKLKYGLVSLPWWLKPDDIPIIDPRRLLSDGNPQYFAGVDTAKGPRVEVTETWFGPKQNFPMGSYRRVVAGKVTLATGEFAQEGVPSSPYLHGRPPFTVYSEFASWPEDWKEKKDD